ncbi:MAG: hypothetical protein IJV88_03770 [Ruminococcus sp.]|nr:hypothetical protein [Ruminococcus sp.]
MTHNNTGNNEQNNMIREAKQELIENNVSEVATSQRKSNRIVKLVLTAIAVIIFIPLPFYGKLLFLQYAPLIIAIIFFLLSSFFNSGKDSSNANSEENRRLITAVEKKPGNETKLKLYYLWEGIVLITQVVVVILLTIFADGGFFNKITTFFVSAIMGLICYTVLTGQAHATTTKGKPKKDKNGQTSFEKTIFPNKDREYVVETNTYRDENGNHYDLNGVPVPTPVNINIKK